MVRAVATILVAACLSMSHSLAGTSVEQTRPERHGQHSGGVETQDQSEQAVRRRQEIDDLSARLRRAEERSKGGRVPSTRPDLPLPGADLGDETNRGDEARSPAEQVAVLLVMRPGSKGIRRLFKTADPVLCVDRTCYVSRGIDVPAAAMSRARALGPGNSLGARAGACRDSLGCIFRAVTLDGKGAVAQPIDMRILVHDRRQAQPVFADPTCHIGQRGLICDRAIVTTDYTMWVVPERLVDRIGASALRSALAQGLQTGRMASARLR